MEVLLCCFRMHDSPRLDRNVEVFEVTCSDTVNIILPCCILENSSLVVLKLATGLLCKLPENGIVCLPNLNKFHVCISELNHQLMDTLCKSSPQLQDLSLDFNNARFATEFECLVEIAALELKSLALNAGSGCSFVIDAPNLEHLIIKGGLVDYRFVKIPAQLQSAYICCYVLSLRIEFTLSAQLVRGLLSVRSLCITNSAFYAFIDVDYITLPIFHNLIHLNMTLGNHGSWNELLLCLRCSPNLEVLSLSLKNYGYVENARKTKWDIVDSVPTCLATKLGNMELRYFRGYEDEFMILEYILEVGNVLERLVVNVSSYGRKDGESIYGDSHVRKEDRLWKEYDLCERLFKLQKSSLNCEIVFIGYYITSSSKGLKNGTIDCQLRRLNTSAD